jgi:hypothetical protein
VVIGVEFDGPVIGLNRDFADVSTPATVRPDAVRALRRLHAAGHTLLLTGPRANRAGREAPELDPLARAGVRRVNPFHWAAARELHRDRYDFMATTWRDHPELHRLFDAVDDGAAGYPAVDLLVTEALLDALPHGWNSVAAMHGR